MYLAEIWLNIPQAVVLEATGDLVRARALDASDPDLLVIKATWLLPPMVSAPVDAGASAAEARRAFRSRMGEVDAQAARGGYERALRQVHAKLINGVTTKGSRAPHLPVEVIDPAEFARLELRNIDAVDPRTGKTVWHGLLISAREFIESDSGNPSSSELDSQPAPIGSCRPCWGNRPNKIIDHTCPSFVGGRSALVVRETGFGVDRARRGGVGRSRLGGGEAAIFRAGHKSPPARDAGPTRTRRLEETRPAVSKGRIEIGRNSAAEKR